MKRIFFPILIFAATLFSSCEDIIEVKLNDDDLDLYAVEASITTADGPEVFLYKGLSVSKDENYTGVSDAKVTLADNATPSNTITLIESASKKGLYVVPEGKTYKGVAGREYTLTILKDGVTVSGKDMLASVAPIDSIQVHPSQRGEQRFLGVFSFGYEPAGLGNYYKWEVYINGVYYSDAEYLAFASDEMVDGNYISGVELFTDYHNTAKPSERRIKLNDTITVRQNSISKFMYGYYSQIVNQNGAGSLFSVPPANVKSNLTASDGKPVLGYFTAQDVSVSNSVVVDQTIESQINTSK